MRHETILSDNEINKENRTQKSILYYQIPDVEHLP